MHRLTVKQHFTTAGGFQPGENSDQRGFAATGRADHAHEFTLMGFEVDVFERGNRAFAAFKLFMQAAHFQCHRALLESLKAVAHGVALLEIIRVA